MVVASAEYVSVVVFVFTTFASFFVYSTECEVCQYSLGNDTLIMKESFEVYWNDSKEVEAIQEQDAALQVCVVLKKL